MAYATVQDLETRWRGLTPDEQERAQTLLDDASLLIEQYDDGKADRGLFCIVACNMVQRAMRTDGDAFALGGDSMSAGFASYAPSGMLERPLPSEVAMLRGKPTKAAFARVG